MNPSLNPARYSYAKFIAWIFLFNLFTDSAICLAQQANTNAYPALTVTLAKVQRVEFTEKVSANGNIAPWQEVVIGSELNDIRLNSVLVNVGDVVKKGQLLATFSAETIEAELAEAKGNLAEAEALAKEAENNAARSRTLLNTGALSNQQLDQFSSLAETAKARLEVSKAIVSAKKIRLNNTKIYAPDSGVISARNATAGSIVSSGNELFKLIRQSRLEWRAEVISTDLPKIKTNMPVKITAEDGSVFDGKVRKISPTVDMQTRNSLVYVDLPQNLSVKAGMYAKGEFLLGQSIGVSVPQQALVMRDGFTYAFIVVDNHAKKIKVKTGERIGNSVQILTGLTLNQEVVAKGVAFLSDNDTVKVIAKPSLDSTHNAVK
jgi:HlyD family secretion protein